MMKTRWLLTSVIFALLLMASCQTTPTPMASGTPVPTRALPTAAPTLPAAFINGEPISMESFEMELSRYEDVHGTDLATVEERSEVVIQALIERHLLAQGARSLGISVTEEIIDDRIEQLIINIGSESTFQSWLQENHYTMETFREDLKEELIAAAMIERITDDVSDLEIHAHARHILVTTEEEAAQILDQILAGADFAELAVLYTMDLSTRPAGGDLGWFPRGTLTTPGLEEAIFSLSPGDIGEVIASDLGYHVVQLLELEERPLTTHALTTRYRQAVEDWLETQLVQSVIEVFVTP